MNAFHTAPQGSTFHHASVPTPSSLLLFTLEQVWEKLTMNGFIYPFSSFPLIYLHSQQETKRLNAVRRFLRNVDCHSSKITTTNIYGLYSGGMQLNRIEFFLLLKTISAAGFEASPWAVQPVCAVSLLASRNSGVQPCYKSPFLLLNPLLELFRPTLLWASHTLSSLYWSWSRSQSKFSR